MDVTKTKAYRDFDVAKGEILETVRQHFGPVIAARFDLYTFQALKVGALMLIVSASLARSDDPFVEMYWAAAADGASSVLMLSLQLLVSELPNGDRQRELVALGSQLSQRALRMVAEACAELC